jgi:hypothetical protein
MSLENDNYNLANMLSAEERKNERLKQILKELLQASAPYLKRKKETPRAECKKLNEVWARARELI